MPRAAVHTRHYLRVPAHRTAGGRGECMAGSAAGAGSAWNWLATRRCPGSGPEAQAQVLVLIDAVAQATVDTGPCTRWPTTRRWRGRW